MDSCLAEGCSYFVPRNMSIPRTWLWLEGVDSCLPASERQSGGEAGRCYVDVFPASDVTLGQPASSTPWYGLLRVVARNVDYRPTHLRCPAEPRGSRSRLVARKPSRLCHPQPVERLSPKRR